MRKALTYPYRPTGSIVAAPTTSLPQQMGEVEGRESAFVACSFWMVQNIAGSGRRSDAEKLLDKLIHKRNDVGLLSEEYDPVRNCFMGNFPQALSHIALINAARMLGSA